MRMSILNLIFGLIATLSTSAIVEGASIPLTQRDTTSASSHISARSQGGFPDKNSLNRKRDVNIGHVLLAGADIEPRDAYQVFVQYSDAWEFDQPFPGDNNLSEEEGFDYPETAYSNDTDYDRYDDRGANAPHNNDASAKYISNKHNEVYDLVQGALKKFTPGKSYCTTKYHHSGEDIRSHAVIDCQNSYSIQLWNERPKNGTVPSDIRIFCDMALQIADETLQAVFNNDAAVMSAPDQRQSRRSKRTPNGQRVFPEGQRGLTNSWWSEDPSWGVSIVFRENGCPAADSKEWIIITNAKGGDPKKLTGVGSNSH
ncbi:hypothetical protein ABW21_db0207737 [Orbilia brochopaga]|nr:hypothetical protein ABW21_db0207737 [Drechslerella brochopaga]